MDQELIDDDFGGELMYGRGFSTIIFEGANENPQKIADKIFPNVTNMYQMFYYQNQPDIFQIICYDFFVQFKRKVLKTWQNDLKTKS